MTVPGSSMYSSITEIVALARTAKAPDLRF
jgi:hypothetical protein